MKTIEEYYKIESYNETQWRKSQKGNWWKKYSKDLDTKGDYIETVSFINADEKNDAPIITNNTNVVNSEWSILFSMLGRILIEWLNETGSNDIHIYGIDIRREVNGIDNIYYATHFIKNDEHEELTGDEYEKFNDCSGLICDAVDWFLTRQGKNIPNDWNCFYFNLDNLKESCKYNKWTYMSDGSMGLGNNENDFFECFVSCM